VAIEQQFYDTGKVSVDQHDSYQAWHWDPFKQPKALFALSLNSLF
jgi:hypothetical protein